MELAIVRWEKDLQAEENAINGSKLLKDEKVEMIATARAKNGLDGHL